MSLTLYGNITVSNYDYAVSQTKKYKILRLKLSKIVGDILLEKKHEYFIEGGTLMGAHRDGTMIAHDDDFDYGIVCPNFSTRYDFLNDLQELFSKKLPDGYESRVVSSYSTKIEIYQPTHGNYHFRDTDYHNVTIDLTLFTLDEDKKNYLLLHSDYNHLRFPVDTLFPLKQIEYEGIDYPAPCDPKRFLEVYYGYIGPGAIFNKETGYYEPNNN